MTEPILAEQRLRESEERFRLASQAMEGLVYDWDVASGHVTRSEGLFRLLGCHPEEAEPVSGWWRERIHPDDLAAIEHPARHAAESGRKRFEAEYRVRHKDGRWVQVLDTGYVVCDADRRPVRAVGITVDVTARRQAEMRLRESEARLRALTDNLPGGMVYQVETSRDMRQRRYTYVSGNCERVTGVSAEQALADPAALIAPIDPADWPRVSEAEQAAARDLSMLDIEVDGTLPDGRKVTMHIYSQPREAAGDRLVWDGLVLDVTARREAERALHAQAEETQTVLDTVPAGIWIAREPDCREITGNARSHELLRVPLGVNQSKSNPDTFPHHFRFLDEEGRELAAEELPVQRAAQGRGVRDYEYRVAFDDGSFIDIFGNAVPLTDAAGRLRGAVAAFVDITQRKAIERALRDSEARFRGVAEAVPGFVWTADAKGDIDYASQRWTAYSGRKPEEGYAQGWTHFVHPDDLETATRKWRHAVRTGQPYEAEFRLRRADGVYRWWLARAMPADDDDAEARRWIGVCSDIQEIVLARETLKHSREELETLVAERTGALAESERRFRAIFDTTFQLTGLGTLDGTILIVNRAALEAVNATQEQVAGTKMWEAPWWAPSPHEARRLREGVARVAKGEFVRYESELLLPAGPRSFDFSMKPVLDEHGKPVLLVAEGRDITDLKRTEEALRQSQKMEAVGQLTGGIAHDFNNLLGAVVGSLDLIRRRPDDAERVRRFAEAGLAAAERGAKLTGQLLAFSRAQRIELKPLVVASLVEGMRDLLARTLGPMVRLHFDLDEMRAAVLSDPTQLEMAVLNLAINARDAMPEGGDLTIRTRLRGIENDPELQAGDYVELSVSDTGSGMSAEVAARAFDPFFTTKGVGKGTGLGLSQAYGIAKQAGGTARIESRLGHGTTVTLLLRRSEREAPASRSAPEGIEEAETRRTAKILLVDDDPDMRRVLGDALDTLGFAVMAAASGPEALSLLAENTTDLMVVDFAMPGMNGAELARAARELRADLPILFASGYSDTEAIENALGHQAIVLRKPFRVDELQAALNAVLNRES